MADRTEYDNLAPGFYWVRAREGVTAGDGDWEIAELTQQLNRKEWDIPGSDEGLPWGEIEEIGPRCEVWDSKAREAWDAAMADVEEMQCNTHTDEGGKLCFGPFTEWYQASDHAVVVSWYNLIYHLEQREKLLAEAAGS